MRRPRNSRTAETCYLAAGLLASRAPTHPLRADSATQRSEAAAWLGLQAPAAAQSAQRERAQNFIESRREQGFLLPPDVRDWLGADHLAWFVIDAVERMDLSGFYAAYRADGHGRAAYEPSLMVGVILFAFATGVRSSRAIERHCREHVAFRRDYWEFGS